MSGSPRIGRTPSALRLDDRFRYGLYAAFTILFASGAIWLIGDAKIDSANGEFWQDVSAKMLMIHGGAAMLALLMLGALIPIHIQRAWRGRLNQLTGIAMVTVNTVLVLTAFGLYYAGSDTLRGWTSDIHIAFGLAFPVIILLHIVIGRARKRASSLR
jgi:Na+-translocating ferredoxin:NAD+ oxidoreductase RnfE subunit